MKIFRWSCVTFIFIMLLMAALVVFPVTKEESKISKLELISDEMLNKLEKQLGLSAEKTITDSNTNTNKVHTDKISTDSPYLKSAISKKALSELFANKDDIMLPYAQEKLSQSIYTYAELFNIKSTGNWAYDVAMKKMKRHDWNGAYYYLHKALLADNTPEFHRICCAQLAILEEDPVKATRLLLLSLKNEDRDSLYLFALHICFLTQSEELEEYILNEFKLKFPEYAIRYKPSDNHTILGSD